MSNSNFFAFENYSTPKRGCFPWLFAATTAITAAFGFAIMVAAIDAGSGCLPAALEYCSSTEGLCCSTMHSFILVWCWA